MNNKMIIGALAEDVYRVAVGLHSGAAKMADMFMKQALLQKEQIDSDTVKPYIEKTLKSLPIVFEKKNIEEKAEDALMLSAILRNYAQTL
jgi:hypothetical protein